MLRWETTHDRKINWERTSEGVVRGFLERISYVNVDAAIEWMLTGEIARVGGHLFRCWEDPTIQHHDIIECNDGVNGGRAGE